MRKLSLMFLCVLSVVSLFAQQHEEAPFGQPQELAYLDFCQDSDDPSRCTLLQLESRIMPILEKYVKKFKKDTLAISLRFKFDSIGHTTQQDIRLGNFKKSLSQKIIPEMEEALSGLNFNIINYNNSKYPSDHTYKYEFLVDKSGKSLTIVSNEDGYTGGTWGQVPLFPDCPRRGDKLDRMCFQESMQAHIRRHFQYPHAALRYGIQGKVDVSFVINTNGEVTKLNMISKSETLKKEAARIVSLLPTFKPGMQNGKAVNVPYSIPIWFRLQ